MTFLSIYRKENFSELKKRDSSRIGDTWFERSELERVERVGCRKLDDVLLEFADDIEFYFLKIDAQGAEYEILKGAERLLSTHCLGLYPELFVIPLYKGITLLSEVERYL